MHREVTNGVDVETPEISISNILDAHSISAAFKMAELENLLQHKDKNLTASEDVQIHIKNCCIVRGSDIMQNP